MNIAKKFTECHQKFTACIQIYESIKGKGKNLKSQALFRNLQIYIYFMATQNVSIDGKDIYI